MNIRIAFALRGNRSNVLASGKHLKRPLYIERAESRHATEPNSTRPSSNTLVVQTAQHRCEQCGRSRPRYCQDFSASTCVPFARLVRFRLLCHSNAYQHSPVPVFNASTNGTHLKFRRDARSVEVPHGTGINSHQGLPQRARQAIRRAREVISAWPNQRAKKNVGQPINKRN